MATILGKIKNRKQFKNVASSGKKWVTPGFIIQVGNIDKNLWISETKKETCVGFTVSKKVGGAVIRNRVKRRLRAVVENMFKADKMITGKDYVVIGRREAHSLTFNTLVRDMGLALRKLGCKYNG